MKLRVAKLSLPEMTRATDASEPMAVAQAPAAHLEQSLEAARQEGWQDGYEQAGRAFSERIDALVQETRDLIEARERAMFVELAADLRAAVADGLKAQAEEMSEMVISCLQSLLECWTTARSLQDVRAAVECLITAETVESGLATGPAHLIELYKSALSDLPLRWDWRVADRVNIRFLINQTIIESTLTSIWNQHVRPAA